MVVMYVVRRSEVQKRVGSSPLFDIGGRFTTAGCLVEMFVSPQNQHCQTLRCSNGAKDRTQVAQPARGEEILSIGRRHVLGDIVNGVSYAGTSSQCFFRSFWQTRPSNWQAIVYCARGWLACWLVALLETTVARRADRSRRYMYKRLVRHSSYLPVVPTQIAHGAVRVRCHLEKGLCARTDSGGGQPRHDRCKMSSEARWRSHPCVCTRKCPRFKVRNVNFPHAVDGAMM